MDYGKICPYSDCEKLRPQGGCGFASSEVCFNHLEETYRLCPDGTVSRIIRSCSRCGSTNQLMAKFCRRCGAELAILRKNLMAQGLYWDVEARPPGSNQYFRIPQMKRCGDLLISTQGTDYVFTALASGETVFSVPCPGPPNFSATPAVIGQRMFCCAPGIMWEFSLVDREANRIDLKGFSTSATGYPVHIRPQGRDLLTVPGSTDENGNSSVLFFDVRTREYSLMALDLAPGDSLYAPSPGPQGTVIVVSRLGKAIAARQSESNPLEWEPIELDTSRLTEDRIFSAPAYLESSDCVFVECVERPSFNRKVLVFGDSFTRTLSIGNAADPECYPENELNLLVYAPLTSGEHVILRSTSLPGEVHFVSTVSCQTVRVGHLEMHPIAMTAGEGSVITVRGSNLLVFNSVPGDQTAREIAGPACLGHSMIVNRPLQFLGKIFVQTGNRLIGLEVV